MLLRFYSQLSRRYDLFTNNLHSLLSFLFTRPSRLLPSSLVAHRLQYIRPRYLARHSRISPPQINTYRPSLGAYALDSIILLSNKPLELQLFPPQCPKQPKLYRSLAMDTRDLFHTYTSLLLWMKTNTILYPRARTTTPCSAMA